MSYRVYYYLIIDESMDDYHHFSLSFKDIIKASRDEDTCIIYNNYFIHNFYDFIFECLNNLDKDKNVIENVIERFLIYVKENVDMFVTFYENKLKKSLIKIITNDKLNSSIRETALDILNLELNHFINQAEDLFNKDTDLDIFTKQIENGFIPYYKNKKQYRFFLHNLDTYFLNYRGQINVEEYRKSLVTFFINYKKFLLSKIFNNKLVFIYLLEQSFLDNYHINDIFNFFIESDNITDDNLTDCLFALIENRNTLDDIKFFGFYFFQKRQDLLFLKDKEGYSILHKLIYLHPDLFINFYENLKPFLTEDILLDKNKNGITLIETIAEKVNHLLVMEIFLYSSLNFMLMKTKKGSTLIYNFLYNYFHSQQFINDGKRKILKYMKMLLYPRILFSDINNSEFSLLKLLMIYIPSIKSQIFSSKKLSKMYFALNDKLHQFLTFDEDMLVLKDKQKINEYSNFLLMISLDSVLFTKFLLPFKLGIKKASKKLLHVKLSDGYFAHYLLYEGCLNIKDCDIETLKLKDAYENTLFDCFLNKYDIDFDIRYYESNLIQYLFLINNKRQHLRNMKIKSISSKYFEFEYGSKEYQIEY